MAQNSRKVFTKQMTGAATFTVTSNEGFQRFTIFNSSATTGTFIGDAVAGGEASSAIDVAQNETAVVDVGNGWVIDYLLVTAPASCTLKMMGS